jgi:hypothetical protein
LLRACANLETYARVACRVSRVACRVQEREKGGGATSMDQFRGVTFQILFTVPVASTKEKEFTVPSPISYFLLHYYYYYYYYYYY